MGGKAKDPNKAALKAQREQMKRLDAIDVPELKDYILQSPELVGLLNAEEIGKSALEDITTDPRLKAIQQGELERLGKESEEGMSAAHRLQMEEMLGAVGAQEKSQRAAINQEMARQGMGDSGAALQAKQKSCYCIAELSSLCKRLASSLRCVKFGCGGDRFCVTSIWI